MAEPSLAAKFIAPDGHVAVLGRWFARPQSALYLGEIRVITPTHILTFSSVTPMSPDGLAGYATPEYLARHAERLIAR